MDKKLEEIFIRQMLLPKEELAMQTMELLADKMDLQSKIDKAIEYAKDNLPERDYMGCLLTDEDVTLNMILEKLLDILKENNNE